MAKRQSTPRKKKDIPKERSYKRDPEERKQDQLLAFRMHLVGYTQQQIADEINQRAAGRYTITRQQISQEIRAARKQVRENNDRNYEELLDEQIQEIEYQKQELYAEWNRSKQAIMKRKKTKKKSTKKKIGFNKNNVDDAADDITEEDDIQFKETRLADARYMKLIAELNKDKANLLALYRKTTTKNPDGSSETRGQQGSGEGSVVIYIPDNGRDGYADNIDSNK